MPKLPFSSAWVRQLILNRIGDRLSNIGLFLTDLQSGATVEINPDQSFKAGSVAKIPVAMTILHLVTQGQLSLDDRVTYNAETDYAEGAGSLRYSIKDGDQLPIGFLIDRLIRVSDNIAWNMLERYVGPATVQEYARSLGVQSPYREANQVLTPRDSNALLVSLDRGQAGISAELTRHLIDLMATAVFLDRIPANLPPQAYVATKVGSLVNETHDVGLVYAPQRSFAISVFTQNLPYEDAINLIADLAAITYWYEDWLVQSGGG